MYDELKEELDNIIMNPEIWHNATNIDIRKLAVEMRLALSTFTYMVDTLVEKKAEDILKEYLVQQYEDGNC